MTDDTSYDRLLDQIEHSILLADALRMPLIVEILTIAFREAMEADAKPRPDAGLDPKLN